MSVEVKQEERARFLIRQAFNQWDGKGAFADLIAGQMIAFRAEGEEAMRERAAAKVEQRLALIPTLTDRAGSAVLACIPDAIRSIDTRGE